MQDNYQDDGPVETGLVAATVTPTQPATAPSSSRDPAAAAPVPSTPPMSPARAHLTSMTPMPDDWDLHKVAALVNDVAANMYELPYILKKHGLTDSQYATLEKNPFFQRALEAEVITWQGANSIQKRLALEAAIAVETSLPTVAARMTSKSESLADIVALMKLFSEMAGVIGAKSTGPVQASERFKITINLGGDDTLQREATPSTTKPVITLDHTTPNG